MANKQPAFFPPGINNYVPGYQYYSDVEFKGFLTAELGTPVAADADAILADYDADAASLATVQRSGLIAAGRETEAVYGRCVSVTPSGNPGATGFVIDVFGEDYLGQPVRERFSIANGATTAAVGNKAFKRVSKVVGITAATNAILADIGWADKFGLPMKMGQFLGGSEGSGDVVPGVGVYQEVDDAVDVSGANAATFTSPVDGFLIGAEYEVTTAITTAAAVMDAISDGVGVPAADFIIPIAAAGHSGQVIIDQSAWVAVSAGDTITFTSNGGPDAGVADIRALFSEGGVPLIVGPDLTDPATATTRDPRGLYIPHNAPNGANALKVRYIPDNSVNGDSNGGLHGIRHTV